MVTVLIAPPAAPSPEISEAGPFREFHCFEIGRVHDPRSHVLRADLDAVVERVDLAIGEAAHRERRRLGRVIP
ncbi:hypothetical protein ACVWWK_006707 [Bradyrhizobium sp. LB9.1b]